MFDAIGHDLFTDDSLFGFEPWEIDVEPVDFETARVGGEWVIEFPANRSAGVVLLRDPNGAWTDHAPAYGKVAIPGDAEIGIRWDASAPLDEAVLSRLP